MRDGNDALICPIITCAIGAIVLFLLAVLSPSSLVMKVIAFVTAFILFVLYLELRDLMKKGRPFGLETYR